MSSVSRPAASETTTFTYDGRSFLASADQTAGGTGFVDPVYSSEGVAHKLTRQDDGAGTSEEIFYLYLAGRPVAQLLIEDSSETYSFLTTDHLGTPLLATDEAGAVTWAGAFEPFGADWQAQSSSSALIADLGLRLPGQFDDPTWEDATLGAPLYYKLNRWYEYQTGRYTRADPLGLSAGINLYLYAIGTPLQYTDPLGLATFQCARPLRRLGGTGRRSGPEWKHNPFFHEFFCIVTPDGETECHSQTSKYPWGPGQPTTHDTFAPDQCTQIAPDDWCFENCLRGRAADPRPWYGFFGPGTNCQEWTGDAVVGCRQRCDTWREQVSSLPGL